MRLEQGGSDLFDMIEKEKQSVITFVNMQYVVKIKKNLNSNSKYWINILDKIRI